MINTFLLHLNNYILKKIFLISIKILIIVLNSSEFNTIEYFFICLKVI